VLVPTTPAVLIDYMGIINRFKWLLRLYNWNTLRLFLDISINYTTHFLRIGAIIVIRNWSTYFVDYFKPTKGKRVVYTLRNGVKIETRSGTVDKEIIDEIWIDRSYTPKDFEIHENDTIVDIGAHIGVFSIFASQSAKRGIVYAIEPIKENFEMLKDNIEINRIQNIIPIENAVSDKTGSKQIFLGDTGMHSFYFDRGNKRTDVRTISFKDFIEQNEISRIDLLKMDCEGAEYEILFGCPEDILEVIRRITLEYHNIDNVHNVLFIKEFLEKKGFKVTYKIATGDFLTIGHLYAKRYVSLES
jgi:FkbM family methyltransferase